MTQQQIIGARSLVSFVADTDQNVPAKVDTGADYSSVWASDIVESNGSLTFVLFGPGSRYYTGVKHSSRHYEVTNVTNSFGHSELRYKVELSIRLESRRIKARFNLADRSRNRYPVLIGKRTLSNKFLVNTGLTVSSGHTTQVRVLMLNSLESASVRNFAQTLTNTTSGLVCDFSTYDDLIICLENGKKAQVIRNSTGDMLEEYDLVYFKTHLKRQEFAGALSEVFDSMGVQYIDQEIRHHVSNEKVTQYARLCNNGIPIPKTLLVNATRLNTQYDRFVQHLKLPFVLKDPAADKGLRNYLIRDKDDFERVVETTESDQLYFVAQEFIENAGDLRVIVLDKKVELVIGRRAAEESSSHLNNTSTGGSAMLLPVSKIESHLKSMSVKAALALHRQVAGVDLIQDVHTKKWYVLEVNNSPQVASGAFTDEKIKIFGKFLRRYASK